MTVLADMLANLLSSFVEQSFWQSLLNMVMAWLLAYAVARGLYRILRDLTQRLAGGPVFLLSSLVVALLYVGLLIFFTAAGMSFERGVLEVISRITLEPLDMMGGYEQPFLVTLLYPLFHLVYVLLVLLLAWALGLLSADKRGGSAAQAVEDQHLVEAVFISRFQIA